MSEFYYLTVTADSKKPYPQHCLFCGGMMSAFNRVGVKTAQGEGEDLFQCNSCKHVTKVEKAEEIK